MSEGLKEVGGRAARKTALDRAWQEWLAQTTAHPKTHRVGKRSFVYEFRRYGQALAQVEPKGDYLVISRLETLETGQGAAKGLVRFLKSLADKNRVRLYARAVAYRPDPPVPAGHLLTQAELQAWYGRLGFQVWQINMNSADVGYPDLPVAWR